MEIKLLTKQEKANERKVTLRTLSNWISQNKINYFLFPQNKKSKYFLPTELPDDEKNQ